MIHNLTAELYIFLFAVLGIYVIADVWHRTADERRHQQLVRAQRDAGNACREATASGTGRK